MAAFGSLADMFDGVINLSVLSREKFHGAM